MIDEKICGLSSATQAKLTAVFKKRLSIDKVILYGSRAMGNFKPASDIDLSIFSRAMSLKDLLALQLEIDDLLLPYKVDLSLFHHIDNSRLIEHIQSIGVDFYPIA